jgi:hypothetical protein
VQRYSSPNNTLSEEIILKIIDYFEEASVTDPGAKQANRFVRDINGKKIKVTHAKHYYPTTGTEFFQKFIEKNPELKGKVGQRTFDSHRPWYFAFRYRSDRRTCACVYHVGPKLTVESFARYRDKCRTEIKNLNRENNSTIEQPPESVYSLNKMAESICCPKVNNKYLPACLDRSCIDCKDSKTELTPEEKEHCAHIVGKLRCFKYVSAGLKEGKDGKVTESKKLDYVEEPKTGQEICDHLNNKLPGYPASHVHGFPEHQFRACHNQDAHDEWLQDMIHQEVGVHYMNLDWAERMAVLINDKAMSLHWNQKAVGILVGIHIRHAHVSDDGEGHTADRPKLWKRHVFWTTDVMDQGHRTVQAARYMLWEHDVKNGITFLSWVEWSDGCAEQFRCRHHNDRAESITRLRVRYFSGS